MRLLYSFPAMFRFGRPLRPLSLHSAARDGPSAGIFGYVEKLPGIPMDQQ